MHLNRTNMRADKTKVVRITNMKRPNGTPIFKPGCSRLSKEIERYTMECPICGTEGEYDDRGDVVCSDMECRAMITDCDEGAVYPEDGYADVENDSSSTNAKGASGHPLMRTPALNPAGPKTDAKL